MKRLNELELQGMLVREKMREADWDDPWNQALLTAAQAEMQAFSELSGQDRELTRGWRIALPWRLIIGTDLLREANAHAEASLRILGHVRAA